MKYYAAITNGKMYPNIYIFTLFCKFIYIFKHNKLYLFIYSTREKQQITMILGDHCTYVSACMYKGPY